MRKMLFLLVALCQMVLAQDGVAGEFSPELYPLEPGVAAPGAVLPGSFRSRKGMGLVRVTLDRLSFEVPQAALARLLLLDLQDRLVAELFQGETTGMEEVVWNGGELPEGLYQFKLQQGERSETFRALILR
jgi:hypothetical protein